MHDFFFSVQGRHVAGIGKKDDIRYNAHNERIEKNNNTLSE